MQPQKNPGFLTKVKRDKYLLLLLLPCALYYIIFKYVPIFGISIAFMDYNLFKGITESDWVGFKYFSMFLIRLISGLFSEIHSCWGYTS